MKWKVLPIGQFIDAKRAAQRAYDEVTSLYADTATEEPDVVLANAQVEWDTFLGLAAEHVEGENWPAIDTMTPEQIRSTVQDFFLRQVGKDQKPSA